MPELPEVECLRLKLSPQILGKNFKAIEMRRKDLRYPLPVDLPVTAIHSEILRVDRRSKYLLLHFKNKKTLGIHLGMTGRLFFSHPDKPIDRHDHVRFFLNDGRELRFRDPRRFGLMFMSESRNLSSHKFLKNLGVEPLTKDLNPDFLFSLCKKSTSPIKPLLMNAAKIVGVGNIYASEALFLTKIRPTRKANRITKSEAVFLCQNIKNVLEASIKSGGTTFRDYVDVNENPGLHSIHLKVYGREEKPCLICKTKIKRVTQTGRSSFYCSHCQK